MRRFNRKRKFSRRRRGKYSRRSRRTPFRTRVKRVLMKNSETKYMDIGNENVQLYHNTGVNSYAHVGPVIQNPWYFISQGTSRSSRIGDKIQPIGMKLKFWLSNKLDRPNVNYRIVCCILPRLYEGTAVGVGTIDPGAPMSGGSLGNYLLLPWDKEKGIKVLYDRIIKVQSPWGDATGNTQKECSKVVRLWIKRKRSRPVMYDANGYVLNNPFAVYIIPYDAYGSLTTDNICSIAQQYRMYWKDI